MHLTDWVHLTDSQILLMILTGFVAFLAGSTLRNRQVRRAENRLERSQALVSEHTRTISSMRAEQGTGVNLGLILPMIVRELNRSDLNARRVPGLIVELASSIFRPSQVLLYRIRPTDADRELHLVSHRGLENPPLELQRIPWGVGRIGWTAAHGMEMFREDWPRAERMEHRAIRGNHPMADLEMVAPLIHDSAEGRSVLGVVTIGAPGTKNRDEKMLLQLVTHLGTLALINASNMSQLRDKAHHDGLTGLTNQSHFLFRAATLLLDASRSAEPLSFFIFDIDHFKNYNDTNGHPAGDQLLRELAAVIRENVRPNDLCCRYGGEEFLVAMPQTHGDEAVAVAERIRERIAEAGFAHRELQPGGRLTVSGGISVYPRDGGSLDELIEHADQALYQSKGAGRNRITRFVMTQLGELHGDSV